MTKYNRKDHFYHEAKAAGVRSRAFYKLQELDQKHHLIAKQAVILDLGAWPGGWLEYAARAAGSGGKVIGIDIKPIEPLGTNVETIQGDVLEPSTIDQALNLSGRPFDLILSDLSPSLSGIKEADAAAAVDLAKGALEAAKRSLRPGGNLVLKLFKSNETELFIKQIRPLFERTVRSELKSSRKTSQEFYLVAKSYGRPQTPSTR
jgi:23S rRNA (uridine2552-2'-O)-methyltransferase